MLTSAARGQRVSRRPMEDEQRAALCRGDSIASPPTRLPPTTANNEPGCPTGPPVLRRLYNQVGSHRTSAIFATAHQPSTSTARVWHATRAGLPSAANLWR